LDHPYVWNEPFFEDIRTGRRFCHECIAMLATWELDGCPEAEFGGLTEWIGEENVRESMGLPPL
jgi:hypothetical protein